MNQNNFSSQPLLTFPDAEKSPLSIRAKALVFIDPRSKQLRDQVEQLSTQPLPLLIEGETGTGKELLARHIHRTSERPGLFVALSCSGLSSKYAQAELFGYAAGAYQGSASSRAGWFGSANNGTLYLDEIGDLPLPLQAELLSALETGEVLRVGASQPSPADVRLLAATSIDLAKAVAAGKFNERLYGYLSDGRLELPPLRERTGDILPMAEYFLGIYAQRLSLPLPTISEAAQQRLEAHGWPGNTRELENVIHFALLVSSGEEILSQHLNLVARDTSLTAVQRDLEQILNDAEQDQLQALHQLIGSTHERLKKLIKNENAPD
ncbi:sigma 54-interacting transcriptional regulator [Pseudomonas fluorescens]|uniref:Sigma-54-dependent transcriptional regulator n=1 Tax=Pseudomonas fluorescens TaxID=294 RepID=A0A944HC78_PSEFL|nr:sigma-54-dependent transcriptional regulator [Pseudomonas fluorescens]MBT2298460.1 sigma-54-dependent transcriptional regulator [Pseudomonas fluorescens]MBT2309986.1 sigma-54-dependent transcriptional regulator [Pseudomonas fluorescens]MBT2311009.1 sigma-54-dependent transcriptional regulator [Pseudomonas fluorescens]MBT2320056.1 sigma-54-dependent transcriptional regulator [Pseudomonas fluorescens]MBT2328916.1 sigma-54-dependent transcriptional regulator [Pseudomonas fluorescens]